MDKLIPSKLSILSSTVTNFCDRLLFCLSLEYLGI
ncbi:hypothetical protein [Lactococcus phage D7893]